MVNAQRSQTIIQPKSGKCQRVSRRITRREAQERRDSFLSKIWSPARVSSKTFKELSRAASLMGISPKELKQRLKQKKAS